MKQIHASVLTRLLIIFGTLLLGLFVSSTGASSSPTSSWFETPFSPTLSQEGTIPRGGLNNINSLNLGGKCDDEVMLTRDFYPSWALWRQTVNSCWRNSSAGLISEGSNPYLIAKDAYIAGRVQNLNTLSTLTPTPDDFVILEQKGGSGSYKKLHYKPSLSTTRSITGSVTHTLSAQDTFTLKWENGQNASNVSDVGFSSNGRWMVGTTVNTSLFRVDVKTKKILSFGEPIQQSSGWNPFMKVSITDDGNYAVATGTAHAGNQWMRLYDLGDCQDDEKDYIANQHANCKYIDLTDYLRQNIPNFNRFSMAKFGDNNTLVFYHIPAGANDKLQKYFLRAPGTSTGTKSYVAMGDSFASGEGTYRYFRGTDEGEDINGCHLSDKSYPYLIGADLGMNKDSYFSIACSGAKIRNVNGDEYIDITLGKKSGDISDKERTNQYLGPDKVTNNSLGNLLPGYRRQIEFASEYKPDAATISIIGNDIGFGKKLAACLMPETCYSSYEDRLAILREVRGKFDELVGLYQQIIDESGGKTRLYVIGYPKFANPDGNCALNVGMERDELIFGNQLVAQLNDVIEAATNRAGVVYVDIENIFDGQALCDGKHLAFNGLSRGQEQLLGVIGKESFHPNQTGYKLMRDAIWQQTNQLTRPMPEPNESTAAPTQEDDLDFLNRPKTNQPYYYSTYYTDSLTPDIVYKHENTSVTAGDLQNFFKPNSSVEIVLRSDPVTIATTTASLRGYVDTDIRIPDAIQPGFHTINLLGQDLEGNKINLQKIVYVAETTTDKNGNGLADTDEPCGPLTASRVDEDTDNIDDACDPDIGDTPLLPTSKDTDKNPNITDTPKDISPGTNWDIQPAINPSLPGINLVNSPVQPQTTQTDQPNSSNHEVLGGSDTTPYDIDTPMPAKDLAAIGSLDTNNSILPAVMIFALVAAVLFAVFYRMRYANR